MDNTFNENISQLIDKNLKYNTSTDQYKTQYVYDILNRLQGGEELNPNEEKIFKQYIEDLLNNDTPDNEIETIVMPKINNEYMNNTKLAKTISTNKGLINHDNTNINLHINTIPKLNIMTIADLKSDNHLTISTNEDITIYDMAVMDAVYTLLQVNCTKFTPQMVCRVMSGNFEQNVTKRKIDKVIKSLEKLRHIDITIDCTEEIEARKKKIAKSMYNEDNRILMTSYLMPLETIQIKTGNQTNTVGFKVLVKPALYRYAEYVNQIIDIPTKLLQTQEELPDNDEVIIIKRYIIKKVAIMINEKNNITSNRISLEWIDNKNQKVKGLYSELGYFEKDYSNWREKKRKIREIINSTLNSLKSQNLIQDFKVYKEVNEIKGYDIYFH